MTDRSEQEEFLVGKMVQRKRQLERENALIEKQLEKSDLSDEDYDLYQGMMDKNIGEQNAMRRMEDNLREWREIQRNKRLSDGEPPNALCDHQFENGAKCAKSPNHMGRHVDSNGVTHVQQV